MHLLTWSLAKLCDLLPFTAAGGQMCEYPLDKDYHYAVKWRRPQQTTHKIVELTKMAKTKAPKSES
jgi:hypothetical protein